MGTQQDISDCPKEKREMDGVFSEITSGMGY